jgi:hypothetical protein
MTYDELAAALEERLYFYNTVLNRMEAAVIADNMDGVESYAELEIATAAEIAAYQRCFSARAGESPRAEELKRKVEAALETVRASTSRTRGLLAQKKEEAAAGLAEARKHTQAAGIQPGTPPPSVIDIHI